MNFPSVGEKVVLKIKRIEQYGVIADLVEYEGVEAFIHISQVSNSWIKNIRNFVSDGQIRVGQVTEVREDKKEVDTSLRKVSSAQEKKRLLLLRRKRRADKLFEMFCGEIKEDFKKLYEQIAVPLSRDFGDMLTAFEEIKLDKNVLKTYKVPKKIEDALIKFIEKNVTLPEVTLYADLELSLKTGNAIDEIKKVLVDTLKKGVQIEYLSAPKYRLIAIGNEYQSVEEIITNAANFCVNSIEKIGGTGKFEGVYK